MRHANHFSPSVPLGLNLTHGLLNELGRAIVTGAFDCDGFPTEAKLAKQYTVSKAVTREAVKMLTAKGLLSTRARRGSVITPVHSWNLFDPDVLRWFLGRTLSLSTLRHFSDLRASIEPAAAALAARNSTRESQIRIEESYARLITAERDDDDRLGSHIAFHAAVLEASGNIFYAQFRDVVATALSASFRWERRLDGRNISLTEHRTVMDTIVARDTAGAQAAMTAIIRSAIPPLSAPE